MKPPHDASPERTPHGRHRPALLPFVLLLIPLAALAYLVWGPRPGGPSGSSGDAYASAPVALVCLEEIDGRVLVPGPLEEELRYRLSLFGHPIVDEDPDRPETAVFSIQAEYLITSKAPEGGGAPEGRRYQIEAYVDVHRAASDGPPEHYPLSRPIGDEDPERALRAARTVPIGTLLRAVFRGPALGHQEVIRLLDDVVVGTADRRWTFNDSIDRLAEIGWDAVPHLILALGDRRQIAMPGDYPGLSVENRRRLRLYHIADRALSRIFGHVSPLELESGRGFLRRVREAWEGVWAKACPSFGRWRQAQPG